MSATFSWPIRVYYEDTDVAGVVYYANYLKYMERARTEYLRSLGFQQDSLMAEEGVLFAVVHADVTFRQPARFNDMLCVTVAIEDHTRTSVRFGQNVHRDSREGALLCSATIRAACLDARSLRPRAIPDKILELTP